MAQPNNLLFVGPVVHCPTSDGHVQIIERAALHVSNGKVQFLGEEATFDRSTLEPDTQITELKYGELLVPGLVDCHLHAPQFPNIGLGLDKTLLEWLEAYTFPLEASFSDLDKANFVYPAVVRATLGSGTTTALYFATIHEETSLSLAQAAADIGQRALVGKVSMNVNSPDYYQEESVAVALRSAEDFILRVKQMKSPLVQPVVTPRFAISCDAELMAGLGRLAEQHDVHVQTHISETLGEIAAVQEMYPDSPNYADVYDKANLLTNKTVLAHGVYLSDVEVQLLKSRGCAVAHCPNSNTSLRSGLCDVRKLHEAGLKVGLGTDCSGGYGVSVMDSMRYALATSISLSFTADSKYSVLNHKDVFYLATLGGATALGMDSEIGNLNVDKQFDALLVDMSAAPCTPLLQEGYSVEELLQKFVYLADDRNIKSVYVAGRQVKPFAS